MSGSSSTRLAVRIVNAVLTDLNDRSGFDHWWCTIDPDIQREIRHALIGQVHAELPASLRL